VVTDQEGRAEAFKAFLERAKTGLVATGQHVNGQGLANGWPLGAVLPSVSFLVCKCLQSFFREPIFASAM
jgi:hypothetical protein